MKSIQLMAVFLLLVFKAARGGMAETMESPTTWVQLSTNAIMMSSHPDGEKKIALGAFESLLQEWQVSQWPSSSVVVASLDIRDVLRRTVPPATSIDGLEDKRRKGIRLQWLTSSGAEVTIDSCLYYDAERPQYRLLSEMRMFGRPTVSLSEFKDAVFIQTERSLALLTPA